MKYILTILILVMVVNIGFSQNNLVYNILTIKYEDGSTDTYTNDTKKTLATYFTNILKLSIDERNFDSDFENKIFPNGISVFIKASMSDCDGIYNLDINFYCCNNTTSSVSNYSIKFDNKSDWQHKKTRDTILKEQITELLLNNFIYRIESECSCN